jgi:hypothetical protein
MFFVKSSSAILIVLSIISLGFKDCSPKSSNDQTSNSGQNKNNGLKAAPSEVLSPGLQIKDSPTAISTTQRRWKCSDLATTGGVFGITITDTDPKFLEEAKRRIDELSSISKVPIVTRIVLDPIMKRETEPDFRYQLDAYKSYIKEIQKVSCVMGELGDSYDLYNYFPYTKKDGKPAPPRANRTYLEWTNRAVEALGQDVDVWEIGNELNGDWTGWKCDKNGKNCEHEDKTPEQKIEKQREVLRATEASYNEIMRLKGLGKVKADALTAITLYYNEDADHHHCVDYDEARLNTWLKVADTTLNDTIKQKVDFVLLSFYESDCPQVDKSYRGIARTFDSIRKVFKGEATGFGFGEIGYKDQKCKGDGRVDNKNCQAKNPDYIRKYFLYMDSCVRKELAKEEFQKPRPIRYIGGYFYWWYLQDVVRSTKNNFMATRNAFTESATKFGEFICPDNR